MPVGLICLLGPISVSGTEHSGRSFFLETGWIHIFLYHFTWLYTCVCNMKGTENHHGFRILVCFEIIMCFHILICTDLNIPHGLYKFEFYFEFL